MSTHARSRFHSRFIPREEIGEITRWHFSDVQGFHISPLPALPLASAENCPEEVDTEGLATETAEPEHLPQPLSEQACEAIRQRAWEEGYAAGQEHGRQAGRQEGQQEGKQAAEQHWQQHIDDWQTSQGKATAARLTALAQAFETSVGSLQQDMAQQVLQLACDIARQVVRQHVATHPDALLPVVREALDMLRHEGSPATVRLHPQDWAVLEQPLRAAAMGVRGIQWQTDVAIAPGGCCVECAGAVVDGTLEKRWQRAIAALGLTAAWSAADGGASSELR